MDSLLNVGISNAVAAVVLALLAFAVDRVFRRPALSHIVWLLVLLKLVTPPLVHVPLLWPSEPVRPAVALPQELSAVEDADDSTPPRPTLVFPAVEPPLAVNYVTPAPVSWTPFVLGAWLAGSCLWWVVAAVRIARFRRLLRQAEDAPGEVRERVRRLAELMGLRRSPAAAFVPGALSPLLWAPGRKAYLLLPKALWERLDCDQRDSLLVHELAHLRRGDHWVRRLELLALGLYWWHPVAWWARHELQEAEERCCDGWVVRVLPGSAAAYASALVETVAFLSAVRPPVPLGASGGGRARHLKRRVTMILDGKTARPLGRLALVGVLVIGAVLLTLTPGSADPPAASPAEAKGRAVADQIPADLRFVVRRRAIAEQPPSSDQAVEDRQDSRTERTEPRAGNRRGPEAEAAREEVELLEAQLAVKKAQLEAAMVAVEAAKPPLQRAERLFKTNAIGVEDLEKAKVEVRSREMEVAIRSAELREPEVRLRQARRRLAALEGNAAAGEKKDTKPDESRRLNEIQKKLDELRQEIEALRKGRQSGSARPPQPASTPVTYSRQRAVEIANPLTREQREHASEVLLFASGDEGKSWDQVFRAKLGQDRFRFDTPADGRYWLQCLAADRDGGLAPASNVMLLVVDTKRPEITTTIGPLGGEQAIEWQIDEVNPDWKTFLLEARVGDKWKTLDAKPGLVGHQKLEPGTKAVRLRIKDLAGNEVVALQDPLP
jgi:beta-lactamase regulating signal transducer with metallopeptidase domain